MSRSVVLALLLSLLVAQSDAFAPTLPFTKYAATATAANSNRGVAAGIQNAAPSSPVALHMIDPAQSSMLLAAAEPWVQPTISVLDPFLNLFSFAMVRVSTLRYVPFDLQLHLTTVRCVPRLLIFSFVRSCFVDACFYDSYSWLASF